MTTHIESQAEGLSFDLPDITQSQLEQFFRAERGVRLEALTSAEELLTGVADTIRETVKAARKAELSQTSPEYAALVQKAARRVIAMVGRAKAETDITDVEQSGAYGRAAAALGWLGDATAEQVADWRPGRVSWVVGKVAEAIAEARAVPKG